MSVFNVPGSGRVNQGSGIMYIGIMNGIPGIKDDILWIKNGIPRIKNGIHNNFVLKDIILV